MHAIFWLKSHSLSRTDFIVNFKKKRVYTCVVSVCVGARVCKQTCNYTWNSQVYTDCSPPYTEARYIAHWNPETEDSDSIASHTTR